MAGARMDNEREAWESGQRSNLLRQWGIRLNDDNLQEQGDWVRLLEGLTRLRFFEARADLFPDQTGSRLLRPSSVLYRDRRELELLSEIFHEALDRLEQEETLRRRIGSSRSEEPGWGVSVSHAGRVGMVRLDRDDYRGEEETARPEGRGGGEAAQEVPDEAVPSEQGGALLREVQAREGTSPTTRRLGPGNGKPVLQIGPGDPAVRVVVEEWKNDEWQRIY